MSPTQGHFTQSARMREQIRTQLPNKTRLFILITAKYIQKTGNFALRLYPKHPQLQHTRQYCRVRTAGACTENVFYVTFTAQRKKPQTVSDVQSKVYDSQILCVCEWRGEGGKEFHRKEPSTSNFSTTNFSKEAPKHKECRKERKRGAEASRCVS